ncbi:MAG: hypothetical protein OZSIB_3289 [Candidatus Ozemobacter sibiricus]|uniref:General secretion pathway protein G n=1 Tax=Candidatus Ozemobacter sibiricus TaxID=2268124 RepID=A0A367ZR03_9BACT|nr:MAG: hypothetical protein OZSIB_3289 [Candidatus Ozemobacter sibiricus]
MIELMVVVSILGILLSIASRRNALVLERSRDAALMIDLAHLRNAVHQAALESGGVFPATLEELFPRFLSRKPGAWQGARGSGVIGYDPITGKIELRGPDGITPSPFLDSKGRPYGEY